MRKVMVFSTKSNTTTPVETSATTWGELSTYLTSKGLFNPSGMKAIVKETKATLELKDAGLPDGEFVLILIPTKNESGGLIDAEELSEYISDMLEEFEGRIQNYIDENEVEAPLDETAIEAANIKRELGL